MSLAEGLILATILLYLGFMLYIGIVYSKKNESVDDFYLGGRKLGPLVTAMSAEASDMSSWLLMGLPGVAYLSGVADAGWTAIGLAVGTYLNWLIVAKRIRRYSHQLDAITLPQFFSKRFDDKKSILSAISALIIIIFFIPYTASGFAACGKLFHSLFGIHYQTAMIFSAAIIISYTILGGFLAASFTDLIQSCVMTIALIVVLGFGVSVAGGLDAVMENARALPGYLSMMTTYNPSTGAAQDHSFLTICSTMAWGLGYFGMPHVLLRFMAIEKEEKLSTSRRIASIWVVISMTVAVFIGIVGYSMSKVGALDVLTGSNSETIIVQIASLLSKQGALAAIVAGVILAGILAATMSTADSQLLAASSSVSQNIANEFLGLNLSGKHAMALARASMAAIALISVFLAWNPDSSVFGIVSFAWAGFGASFGPVMLCALFWKGTTKAGALAGMVTGGAMVFIWKYLIAPMGGILSIYELLPAFLCALVAIVTVSLLTGKPSQKVLEEFEIYSRK